MFEAFVVIKRNLFFYAVICSINMAFNTHKQILDLTYFISKERLVEKHQHKTQETSWDWMEITIHNHWSTEVKS